LRNKVPAEATGEEAPPQGKRREGPREIVGTCPYPLRRILQHWQAGKKERFSVFLQYPGAEKRSLNQVFTAYHQRQ
jgi:hypothetical protein